jgi:small subunit ribosomal protein S17
MITKKGTITSAGKMTNTVTVSVHRHAVHPIYKKGYRLSKKFLADTNGMDLFLGDEVVIQECRPLSKRKHFKVTQVLKAAPRVSEMAVEKNVEKAIGIKKDDEAQVSSPAKSDSPSAS